MLCCPYTKYFHRLICCKNRCEERAREADRLQAEYKVLRERTVGSLWRTGWLLMVLAAILFSLAIIGWISGESSGFANLVALIAIVVGVRAALNIRAGKELKKNQPNQPLQGTPGKVPSSSTEPEARRP